ncbi:MAG: hypothetical protein AB8I08_14585 [Sandaracinaceae bacterium]
MTIRIAPSLAAFLLIAASGCATQAVAPTTRATVSDSDRYAEALERAQVQYQNEVEMAVSQTYRTQNEANQVAASFDEGRYDYILNQHLAQQGLSERGLEGHASRHADTASLLRTVRDEVAATSFTADLIRDRVRPHPPLMVPFEAPEEGTTEVQVAIVSELQ